MSWNDFACRADGDDARGPDFVESTALESGVRVRPLGSSPSSFSFDAATLDPRLFAFDRLADSLRRLRDTISELRHTGVEPALVRYLSGAACALEAAEVALVQARETSSLGAVAGAAADALARLADESVRVAAEEMHCGADAEEVTLHFETLASILLEDFLSRDVAPRVADVVKAAARSPEGWRESLLALACVERLSDVRWIFRAAG